MAGPQDREREAEAERLLEEGISPKEELEILRKMIRRCMGAVSWWAALGYPTHKRWTLEETAVLLNIKRTVKLSAKESKEER